MVSPATRRSEPSSPAPLSKRKERDRQFNEMFSSDLSDRTSRLSKSGSDSIGEGYTSKRDQINWSQLCTTDWFSSSGLRRVREIHIY